MRGFLWRLRECPKDYRYGGLRAALRWIFIEEEILSWPK